MFDALHDTIEAALPWTALAMAAAIVMRVSDTKKEGDDIEK